MEQNASSLVMQWSQHVPDDKMMLKNIHANLKRNSRYRGKLILEVPLLRKRPMGVPINQNHLREYTIEQILNMVKDAGFEIEKTIGSGRSFYTYNLGKARDAIQIHALKI